MGSNEEKVTILSALECCHKAVDLSLSELAKLGALLIGDIAEQPLKPLDDTAVTKSVANVYNDSISLAEKLVELKTRIATLREMVQ